MKKNNIKCIIIILALVIIVFLFTILAFNKNKIKPVDRNIKIKEYADNNPKYEVEGWLKVFGTDIDYPVIFENYNTNVDEIDDSFLWKIEKSNDILKRTLIFGHNIKNVSSNPLITNENHTRFEQLMSFIYYDFAKNNQFIQYTKNNKEYLYQIFSVSIIDNDNFIVTEHLDKKRYKQYIDKALKDSYFKYNLDVNSDDKIITLVTCTRFFGSNTSYRFKIEGKLVGNNNARRVKVTINDKYKDIEKIMKNNNNYKNNI